MVEFPSRDVSSKGRGTIRTTRWWLAMALISCCWLNLAKGAAASRRYNSKVRGVHHGRRLGEDKDDDKNKDETDPPSVTPSLSPTTTPPTLQPTPAPTPIATSAPTPAPTLAPSIMETPPPSTLFEEYNTTDSTEGGLFVVKFSLVRQNLTAADVLSGKETTLTKAVTNAISFILCAETDFVLVNKDGLEVCNAFKSLADESQSIVSNQAAIEVVDKASGDLEWLEWTVGLLVLQVGNIYKTTASLNLDEDATSDEVRAVAVELMGDTARMALNTNIQEGTFNDLIENEVQTSVVGQEVDTFVEGGVSSLEGDDVEWVTEKPAAFHGLRIAGFAMFFANILVGFVIIKLAARQRAKIEKNKELATLETGGLNTEEGLDMLLNQGRQRSHFLQTSENLPIGQFVEIGYPVEQEEATPPPSPLGNKSVTFSPGTPMSAPRLYERKVTPNQSQSSQNLLSTPQPPSPTPRNSGLNALQTLSLPSLLGSRDVDDTSDVASQAECKNGMFDGLLPDWMTSTSAPSESKEA